MWMKKIGSHVALPDDAQRANSADGEKRSFLTVRWNELLDEAATRRKTATSGKL